MSDVKRMLEALGVESTEAKIARLTGEVADLHADAERDFIAHVTIVEALKSRLAAALSRAEALEGALRDLLSVWWPTTEEGHTGFVDRLGMQFYYETRIWPPFKSAPLEMCGVSTEEERMAAGKAWRDWLEAKRFAASDAARSLLSSPPPTKDAPAKKEDADG